MVSAAFLSSFDIISSIFSVDCFVCSDRTLISSATTANPLPASPALAASMDAFNASKLVCAEICWIMPIIFCISCVWLWSCDIFSFTIVFSCSIWLVFSTISPTNFCPALTFSRVEREIISSSSVASTVSSMISWIFPVTSACSWMLDEVFSMLAATSDIAVFTEFVDSVNSSTKAWMDCVDSFTECPTATIDAIIASCFSRSALNASRFSLLWISATFAVRDTLTPRRNASTHTIYIWFVCCLCVHPSIKYAYALFKIQHSSVIAPARISIFMSKYMTMLISTG